MDPHTQTFALQVSTAPRLTHRPPLRLRTRLERPAPSRLQLPALFLLEPPKLEHLALFELPEGPGLLRAQRFHARAKLALVLLELEPTTCLGSLLGSRCAALLRLCNARRGDHQGS